MNISVVSVLKVIQRSVVKLTCVSNVQDGRSPVSFLLSWCTAAEMPISIKLQLLKLLSSVEDKVCNVSATTTATTTATVLQPRK